MKTDPLAHVEDLTLRNWLRANYLVGVRADGTPIMRWDSDKPFQFDQGSNFEDLLGGLFGSKR